MVAPKWVWSSSVPHSVTTLAFDVETNGEHVSEHAPSFTTTLVGAAWDGYAVVARKNAGRLSERACSSARIVGHNIGGYDAWVIDKLFGVSIPTPRLEDTMLIAHLINEEFPKNLQALCIRWLSVAPWKDEYHYDPSMDELPSSDEKWRKLAEYNARDTTYTLQLFDTLAPKLRRDKKAWRYYRRLLLPAALDIAAVEKIGVHFNRKEAEKSRAYFAHVVELQLAKIRLYGGDDFNPNSPKQVAYVLYVELGAPCRKRTRKGARSTSEEALMRAKFAATNDGQRNFISALLEYRKRTKQIQFIDKYESVSTAAHDGRMRASGSLTSTVTGRTSFFGTYNPQQIPREPLVRRTHGAPNGSVLISADFAAQELRVGGWVADEPNLLAAFAAERKPDLHMQLAETMTGRAKEQVTQEERDRAKQGNFCLWYIGTWRTYQRLMLTEFGIDAPQQECLRVFSAFHTKWNEAVDWYLETGLFLSKHGYVRSKSGRIRHLPYALDVDFEEVLKTVMAPHQDPQLEFLRMACNFLDSSVANDLALIALHEAIRRGHRVSMYVHDSLTVECKERHALEVAEELVEIMEVYTPRRYEALFGVEVGVPLCADAKIGPTLGDLVPWEEWKGTGGK